MNKKVMYNNEVFRVTLVSVLDDKEVFVIENDSKIDILFESEIKKLRFIK